MNNYAKSCFASPDGFSKVFVVSIRKLRDIVPEPGVERTVSTILDGVWNEFLQPHPSATEDLCACKFLLAIDFTRTLKTSYITGLGMCKACTEAVHCVAL